MTKFKAAAAVLVLGTVLNCSQEGMQRSNAGVPHLCAQISERKKASTDEATTQRDESNEHRTAP